jgi:hypothetical protein
MRNLIQVEGHPNLYRDAQTGAIVNCDSIAYNQYVASLSKRESEKREIENIKRDIDEIKELLKELINGSK